MVRILCIFLVTLSTNPSLFSKSVTKSEDLRANFPEKEKALWAIKPIRKTDLKFSANPWITSSKKSSNPMNCNYRHRLDHTSLSEERASI